MALKKERGCGSIWASIGDSVVVIRRGEFGGKVKLEKAWCQMDPQRKNVTQSITAMAVVENGEETEVWVADNDGKISIYSTKDASLLFTLVWGENASSKHEKEKEKEKRWEMGRRPLDLERDKSVELEVGNSSSSSWEIGRPLEWDKLDKEKEKVKEREREKEGEREREEREEGDRVELIKYLLVEKDLVHWKINRPDSFVAVMAFIDNQVCFFFFIFFLQSLLFMELF